MTDTKQTDTKGRFVKGNTVAKDKGVDFGSKPENRHNGAWNKEGTARYRLELIIAMGEEELQALIENPETPVFEKRIAKAVKSSQWKEIEGMINQVYGKPKESVDVTTQGESINPYAGLTTEELRRLAK